MTSRRILNGCEQLKKIKTKLLVLRYVSSTSIGLKGTDRQSVEVLMMTFETSCVRIDFDRILACIHLF